MIPPIIAAQTSAPLASVQHNAEGQGVLLSQNAGEQVQKEQRQIREAVVKKDEAVFYEQHHDAKEEGRNKYVNLYSNKKKKSSDVEEKQKTEINRVNFDLKI
ncbi:MAG: hypothetical protein ACI39Q_02705 [Wujia sp.]